MADFTAAGLPIAPLIQGLHVGLWKSTTRARAHGGEHTVGPLPAADSTITLLGGGPWPPPIYTCPRDHRHAGSISQPTNPPTLPALMLGLPDLLALGFASCKQVL